MKKYTITLLTLFFSITACHHDHHNHANHHMHKMSFDELVARFESPERDKWQKPEAVLAKMGSLKGKTVAEIGAGTGYFTFRLAEKGANVIAGDVDERFLNYIESRRKTKPALAAKVRTLKLPYDNPAFADAGFDKVLTVDVYHHIDNRSEYFARLLKKMKPGSELYIVDFKKGSAEGPPDAMKLAPEVVKEELVKAGFGKIEIDNKTLPQQYIIKLTK